MMGDTNLRMLLRSHLAELWTRRWPLLGLTWAICLAGWLAVALMPNSYMASARVYVDTTTLLTPLMRDLAVRPNVEQQVEVIRRTLLSRPNLEQLMRMTDLDLRVNTPAEHEAALLGLQETIVLTAEGSQLYSVTYSNRDPQVAQRVVQALLNIFVEQNVGTNRRDMEKARQFIDAQIREHEQRLRETEARVADYRQRHASQLETQERIKREIRDAEDELRRFELALETATWTRDQLRFEMSRTPEQLSADLAPTQQQLLQSPATRALLELEEKLRTLQASKTARHPDVIATKRQIETLKGQIGGEPGTGAGALRNPAYERAAEAMRRQELEIGTLVRRIQTRKDEVVKLRRELTALPDIDIELAELNRDYDIIRKNYDQLVQRREAADMAERLDRQTTNVEFRIVDPPVVPLHPAAPNRLLLFIGVLVAALATAAGIVVLTLQMKDTFGTAERLRGSFDLPVLGSITALRADAGPMVRSLEAALLVTAIVMLLTIFGYLVYAYHIALSPPDLAGLIGRVGGQLRLLVT